MLSNIQSEFLKEIKTNKIIEEQNQKKECLSLGLNIFTSLNPPEEDGNAFIAYIFIKIFVLFITFFVILIPYFLQFLPVIIFCNSLETGNIPIIFLTFINIFFAIGSYLGSRGTFVQGCCYCCCRCLYHPSNWVLFVVLIDLLALILDIILTIIGSKKEEFHFLIGESFHIISVFHNLYRQINLYAEFKIVYKKIRKLETGIIKECVNNLLEEKKYYNK